MCKIFREFSINPIHLQMKKKIFSTMLLLFMSMAALAQEATSIVDGFEVEGIKFPFLLTQVMGPQSFNFVVK